MPDIAFDDIDALRAHISDDFGPYGEPLEVTQAMIDAFAEVTGDHQWIHTDAERCRRESPFGTTIAHGFLLLSLVSALRDGGDLRITGAASVINYGSDRLRFISPVPAGGRVHLRRRLVSIEPKPRGTLIEAENDLRVVGADKPAVLYRSLALYAGAQAS